MSVPKFWDTPPFPDMYQHLSFEEKLLRLAGETSKSVETRNLARA